MLGTRAVGLDVAGRRIRVSGAAGEAEVAFEGLVIATGCHPRTLPGAAGLEGVFTLRTVDDCERLRAALDMGPRVAVIGAGFIGSEVAATCSKRGLDVTVIEALPVPMSGALGEQMGHVLAAVHRDHGTKVRLGVGVQGFVGGGRVGGVRLADGSEVAADVVVVGVGVAPATEWLEGSGLAIDNGVVCDSACFVRAGNGGPALENVVAAGDVARWYNRLFGEDMRVEHWTNAVEQGDAAARNLLRGPTAAEPFAPATYFWSDQYDVKIQYVGRARPGDRMVLAEGSIEERRFVAAYVRDDRVVAALAMNRPARIVAWQQRVASHARWEPEPKDT
jgi:NADPH-dependent 2,4-dienoyl-CoA reductase/sulfur reductase-like enzyme